MVHTQEIVCFKICTITYFWRVQGKELKLYSVLLLQLWLFCHLVQMTSAPDLKSRFLDSFVPFSEFCVPVLAFRTLPSTISWGPCFHFFLWSFPFCFFYSAFPFILFPFLLSCVYVKLGGHLLMQQVIWFPILSETM